jgi:CubicO group peptidase (beta-lactamase class C family)
MPSKRFTTLALTLLAVMGALTWLLTHFLHPTPPLTDPNHAMQRIVSEMVRRDRSVKNCALAVATSDGSFAWSGAAGIAHENGQAPMTGDTPIYIASITKLYTATAVMLFIEKGALSLDDPMAKYLPSELIHGIHVYHGKDYSAEITIRELLSHSSGIADYYTEKAGNGKSLFDLFIERPDRAWTVDETIARARNDLTPRFPPGTDVAYSDTNFQLLGKVIEAASGKPLHAVYDEFFFRPLGLEHTWLVGHGKSQVVPTPMPADVFYGDLNITKTRSNGAYWADAGIVSTAQEMITFLQALNQGKIIRLSSLKLMHNWRWWQFPLRYGYGTMYFSLPWPISAVTRIPPLWGHSGSTGSFLYYSEDHDLYMAGSIDQTESKAKARPFVLMGKVIRAIPGERAR